MKLPSFRNFRGQKNPKDNFDPFPDLPPKPSQKKFKTEYVFLSVSLLVFLSTLGLYLSSNKSLFGPKLPSDANSQAQATPTPKPLPTGKQVYNYSHGNLVVGPKPTQTIINPIDPDKGDTQTLTITIPHDKPITSLKAALVTDNQTQELELKNISTDTWQAEWKVKDSYDYKYQIQFSFSDNFEVFTGALTFR